MSETYSSGEHRLRKLQVTTSSSDLNFEQKIEALLALGVESFGLEIGILSRVVGNDYTLVSVKAPDDGLAKGAVFPLADTYCCRTLDAHGPVSFHYAGQTAWRSHPCYRKFGLEAYIGTRVDVDGRTFGTLNFSSPTAKPDPFTDCDLDFLRLMAQWISLELAREQTQRDLVQFKATLDQTLDCVFMFSPVTMKFIYVNRGAMEQVGYSAEEMAGLGPADIKPQFTQQSFRALADDVVASTERMKKFETVHRHKNGKLIPVEVFLQYVESTGQSPRFVAIVRDISERRRIDRMKSEFISTVSHELRTPLTSIHGSLGLIDGLLKAGTPDRVPGLVAIAYKNTHRLIALTNDILDMDKIESGAMRLKSSDFSLPPLLDEAVELNHGCALQYRVGFHVVHPVPDVTIRVDRDRFVQVMTNLLSNAAKFSAPGSAVDISAQSKGSTVAISVRDRGPGIPEAFHDRIFTKFAQADASDTRQKGGTGLGLFITKSLVEQMGGTIGFQNVHGGGAMFAVEFPMHGTPN